MPNVIKEGIEINGEICDHIDVAAVPDPYGRNYSVSAIKKHIQNGRLKTYKLWGHYVPRHAKVSPPNPRKKKHEQESI